MGTKRKLEEIAANLDDVAETLDEIKMHAEDAGDVPQVQSLENIERQVARASDAIDDAVDPE